MNACTKTGEQNFPRFQSREPGSDRADTLDRITLELILLSFGLLVLAMVWTWQIGLEANNIEHRLFHVTENTNVIVTDIQKLEARLK